MVLPSRPVLVAGADMRGAPGNKTPTTDRGPQDGLSCSRHETPAGERVGADRIDAGPRSLARQQYLAAPFRSGVAPVGASVDQATSGRKNSSVALGDAQQIAAGCSQAFGDASAPLRAWFRPIGVPGPDAELGSPSDMGILFRKPV